MRQDLERRLQDELSADAQLKAQSIADLRDRLARCQGRVEELSQQLEEARQSVKSLRRDRDTLREDLRRVDNTAMELRGERDSLKDQAEGAKWLGLDCCPDCLDTKSATVGRLPACLHVDLTLTHSRCSCSHLCLCARDFVVVALSSSEQAQQFEMRLQEAKASGERRLESLEASWGAERANLERQLAEAESRFTRLEDTHRHELAELSDQIKATLQRERDDKRRLQFDNAQLQAKLEDLSRQFEADF